MQLYTEQQAAEVLGCSVGTLRRWRRVGEGPRFVKYPRLVRYRAADLEKFLGDHTRGVAGGGERA